MKKSIVSGIMVLVFTSLSHAQDAPPPDDTATSGSAPLSRSEVYDNFEAKNAAAVDQESTQSAEQLFLDTGIQAQTISEDGSRNLFSERYEQLNTAIGSAQTLEAYAEVVRQLQDMYRSSCESYANTSSTCCNNPESCGDGGKSAMGQIAETGGMLASVAAAFGGGGAAQCMTSLPQLLNMLKGSETNRKGCKLMRYGTGAFQGCVDICKNVSSAARTIHNNIGALQTQDIAGRQALANQVKTIVDLAGEGHKKCMQDLSSGEEKAQQQTQGGQQAVSAIGDCMEKLNNSDDPEEEVADIPNPEDAPENNPNCTGSLAHLYAECGGGGGGNPGGASFKAGVPNFEGGGITTPEIDDPSDNNAGAVSGKTASSDGVGSSPSAAKSGGLGGFGGGGAGGNAQKARGRRGRSGKGNSLIAGHKSGGSGGGGGGGSYGRRSGRGLAGLFKKKKKKEKAKKAEALAALSKLVKGGISPDSSGSIFERVTKRFVTSSAKEKLFDCKRNKKLWMNK